MRKKQEVFRPPYDMVFLLIMHNFVMTAYPCFSFPCPFHIHESNVLCHMNAQLPSAVTQSVEQKDKT